MQVKKTNRTHFLCRSFKLQTMSNFKYWAANIVVSLRVFQWCQWKKSNFQYANTKKQNYNNEKKHKHLLVAMFAYGTWGKLFGHGLSPTLTDSITALPTRIEKPFFFIWFPRVWARDEIFAFFLNQSKGKL